MLDHYVKKPVRNYLHVEFTLLGWKLLWLRRTGTQGKALYVFRNGKIVLRRVELGR